MKHLLISALLLTSGAGFTQSGRSIEVTVSDTVTLKALSGTFVLKIEMDESYYYESEYGYEGEYDYSEERNYEGEESYTEMYEDAVKKSKKSKRKRKKEEAEEKEMTRIMEEAAYAAPEQVEEPYNETAFRNQAKADFEKRKKQWIDYLSVKNITIDTTDVKYEENIYDMYREIPDYDTGNGDAPFYIEIKAENVEQIELVYQFLDSVTNCQMQKKDVIYETYIEKMESIYKDLYKKALIESLVLAKVVGGITGRVIRVFEPTADLADLINMSQDNMKKYMKDMQDKSVEDRTVIVERTFVFELK